MDTDSVHDFLLLACFVLYAIIADHDVGFIKVMSQLITDPLKQYL